jgi:hypothetical protein
MSDAEWPPLLSIAAVALWALVVRQRRNSPNGTGVAAWLVWSAAFTTFIAVASWFMV